MFSPFFFDCDVSLCPFAWSLSRRRSACLCFLSCLCRALPPRPLSFRPSLRGDSHRFNRCAIVTFLWEVLLYAIPATRQIGKRRPISLLCFVLIFCFDLKMGGERLELSYLSMPHFECGASTNSAIRPWTRFPYYRASSIFCFRCLSMNPMSMNSN